MKVTIKENVQAAPGCRKLTTKQIMELDEKVASLGAMAAATGQAMMLVVFINPSGQPICYGDPLHVHKLNPV
jgi:hypothetical protein